MKTAEEIQKQYLKEHPERKGESDKEFALTNYIEWLENKLGSSQDGWVDVNWNDVIEKYGEATGIKETELDLLDWLKENYKISKKSPQTTKH